MTSRVASFRSSGSSVNSLLLNSARNLRNHIRGAVAIANRAPRRFARTVDVGRSGIQHPKARTGVGDDARERLVDLMGDRRCQCAQGRHPRHMRELGAGPVERLLGHLARRHVLHRADEHRPIRDPMGEAAQMLDDAAGGHNPEIEVAGRCQPSHARSRLRTTRRPQGGRSRRASGS